MYVCMYVCICLYIYTYIHIDRHTISEEECGERGLPMKAVYVQLSDKLGRITLRKEPVVSACR